MLLEQMPHTGHCVKRPHPASLALIISILTLCIGVEELAAARPAAAPQQQSSAREEAAVEQWIRANAIPLKTVQAGNGFADMEPLTKIVGNARIVALGEATHGTREFFQLKHRMIEFLATRMGFTIFSIEANMPEAYRLNDYVLNGKGDLAQLLKGMYFWTWDTKEVLEMIRWMREFNQSGKGRIEFTGFDMQTPAVAAQIVSNFASKNDPDYLPLIQQAVPALDDVAGKAQWREIFGHLKSSQPTYLAKGVSSKDVDWAIQNARVVLQCLRMKSGEITRDHAMAENVKWILDQSPGAKIVLWAHNGHVATGGKMMGSELHRGYGDQMVVFGFAFDQGTFQAIEQGSGLRNFTVTAAPAGSLDATLAASGIPIFALDLKHVPADSSAAAWLKEPHGTRSIGAVYSEASNYFNELSPQANFDAILFVNHTTAALPNTSVAMTCPTDMRPVVCIDMTYNVSLRLPERWGVKNSRRWGDQENTVFFDDPLKTSEQTGPSLYYRSFAAPLLGKSELIQETLQQEMDSKVIQRQKKQHLPTYHLLPDTCEARTVGGHAGRSCIAKFTSELGTPMAEYLTLIRSQNILALFFGFIPANDLDSYRKRLDPIIETLQLP
jgi:erythromycin esterase